LLIALAADLGFTTPDQLYDVRPAAAEFAPG
jgi:hypothetical protein